MPHGAHAIHHSEHGDEHEWDLHFEGGYVALHLYGENDDSHSDGVIDMAYLGENEHDHGHNTQSMDVGIKAQMS